MTSSSLSFSIFYSMTLEISQFYLKILNRMNGDNLMNINYNKFSPRRSSYMSFDIIGVASELKIEPILIMNINEQYFTELL